MMSSAAHLWKTFRGKPNSIPGPPENCSASARTPVRLQPGILSGINAESRSASPRNRVRLAPDSASGDRLHVAAWKTKKRVIKTEENEDEKITIREREQFVHELAIAFANGETALIE